MNSFIKSCLMLVGVFHAAATAQSLIAVNPNGAEQGQNIAVTITGQNTRFLQGSGTTSVWFEQSGSTINAGNVLPISNTALNVAFNIPQFAMPGLWDVNVQNSIDGRLTLRNGFTILLAPPFDLRAETVSNQRIKLSWRDNSGSEQGFKIERKIGIGGAYQEIATVEMNKADYEDIGLTPQVQYCYRVRAFLGANNSSYSNECCATTDSISEINCVNPNAAEQNQTLLVMISAQNTNFSQSSDRVWLARGGAIIDADSVDVFSKTLLRVLFRIPLTVATGLWDIFAQNEDGTIAALQNGFTILLGTPNLTATAVSTSRIDLNWTDNSGTEQGFKIERKSGISGTFQEIAVVGPNVTTYFNLGLLTNTEYCYRVRTFDAANNSAYSNESCATTLRPVIASVNPNQAEQNQTLGVTITGQNTHFAQGSGTMSVRFMQGSFTTINASGIAVTNDLSLYADFTIPISSATGLWDVLVHTFVDGLLTLANGFTILLAPPANLSIAGIFNNQINLIWTDNSGTEQGFKIERKTGVSGTFQEIATVSAEVTSYSNIGLAPQTQYCYRVRAFDAADNSTYSNESCATTLSLPAVIISMNPNQAAQNQAINVLITGQNTHFAQGNGTTSVRLAQGGAIINADSFAVANDLSLNANFTIPRTAAIGLWNVMVQTSVDGALTLINGFRILLAPPANLSITAIFSNQINLSWTDNSGTEQGFKIERRSGTSGTFQEIATVNANVTSYSNTGLAAQTQYCYRVRAFEAAGNSAYSNESCVITTSVSAAGKSPAQYALAQNYPNPFSANGIFGNSKTKIEYAVAKPGEVRLEIFDLHGRQIRKLVYSNQPADHYTVVWDGKNDAGVTVPSGVYIYRLRAGGFEQSKKLILAR